MPNSNYARGAAFERTVVAFLMGRGWYAVRAAGSHGLTDVLAVTPEGQVWFIQCKTGNAKMSKRDWNLLESTAHRFGGTPVEVNPTNLLEVFV